MSDIDWKRSDENYLYKTFGHYAVFDRPDPKQHDRSPLQRVMREIKKLRGERYRDHIDIPGGWSGHDLPDFMHESWFQLAAPQKEEQLLRHVDWGGVSEATKDKIISHELRSRDGEISARDEWHLHDQMMRVEQITPNWDTLSSTVKLETLQHSKEVDWRPFPKDFQAIALGYMIRRVVTPNKEGGFDIGGVFEAGTSYPNFGRYGPGGGERDAFEQSRRKGPKRPHISKAEARETFRWAVAQPRWQAFVEQHRGVTDAAQVQALKESFRESIRPVWQQFWNDAKKLDRDGVNQLAWERGKEISAAPTQTLPDYERMLNEAARRGGNESPEREGPER